MGKVGKGNNEAPCRGIYIDCSHLIAWHIKWVFFSFVKMFFVEQSF